PPSADLGASNPVRLWGSDECPPRPRTPQLHPGPSSGSTVESTPIAAFGGTWAMGNPPSAWGDQAAREAVSVTDSWSLRSPQLQPVPRALGPEVPESTSAS